ncbi:UDP-N-acetylmuramate--L-alanine ligase [Oscillatoria sp. FACHB-1407]|uniref:UDP-N-acetylmuramate--L-alanine ligase n=1 Tax=Oscillatoria sp. FACHB-1407 TaxID=2692847 RepID=UPI001681C809|nr:UDP-N-acetylmuramate--L-alanine ligase [Oscillatoria sp. FACHB-1407]MBD2460836.1 UDP-N-acetylmuramate--L-alanine ligase [Oscillatoria sp. FACHB-1407]
MLNSVDFSGRPFHFIGIGGIGMSALAYVLAKRNLPVSGSDISLSHITQRLQEQGAHIFWSQDATNLDFFQRSALTNGDAVRPGSNGNVALKPANEFLKLKDHTLDKASPSMLPQVICSTAINATNPEYRAALDLGCPIFHRSDLLAALIQTYYSIAVAGTHGKTTTSSMIGYLLMKAGLDPTIVVGGEVNAWEGNARLGEGPYLVAEADESDGSLVKFVAEVGVITNIELDHPDHYTTLDQVIDTFTTFAQNCRTLIACIDCPTIHQRFKPAISYSLHPESQADYTVDEIVYGAEGTTARVWERGNPLGRLHLKLLGQHNLSNALAAIAVGRLLNLDFETIAPILTTFEGARRRFEHRGEANHILFIDDYAHHPSEIQATLAAARLHAASNSTPRRVVAVFQPHRFSRTKTFLNEFAQAFSNADLVITTDIYSAGEPDLGLVSGQQLAEAIATHHSQTVYQPTLTSVTDYLKRALQPGDLVMFLGAGNLNRTIPDLIAHYQEIEQTSASTHRK